AAAAIEASPAIDHWQPGAARTDAHNLLGHIGIDPDDEPGRRLTAAERRRLDALVARRVRGEPVALILGSVEFRGLEIRVRAGVFVPRGSSDLLAEQVIAPLRRRGHPVVVDVAAGTAPVGLAAANELPRGEVWALDIAADAVALARLNARRLRLTNFHARAGDMLAPLPARLRGEVDAFCIHPPYVARDEIDLLPAEVTDWEPVDTLTDHSDDGLGLVRRLATESIDWLRPGGRLHVEISPRLSRQVATVLRRAGLVEVTTERDSEDATRVISGRRPGKTR
ncbi:MAG: class I SAM-dependent methyltransferase, partial [Candidatus Dormibacteria bacterium]